MKPLTDDRGLEAWRVLRRELMGRDGPRQEAEFNAIADLPKLKLADMVNFDNLFVRWESELRKHESVSREYFIGKFRRRQIVYKSLPEEIQKAVDIETGKDQLQSYEEFINFVRSISKSNRFKSMPAPKPLSANLVAEEPLAPEYSRDEWVAYLITDEGWNAYQVGEEVPPDALREVLTLVPSKGKGKGFGKKGESSKGSKGKGKFGKGSKGSGKSGFGKNNSSQFNGNCHNCGAYGHRAADCTQPKGKGGAYLMEDQYNHGASGNSNYCAFMIMTQEDSQVDYKNPWKSVGKGPFKPSNRVHEIDEDSSNFNKFGALKESDVEVELAVEKQYDGLEECTNRQQTIPLQSDVPQTKLFVVDFPIPVPDAKFPARVKMPRMPRISKQKKSRFGCDGDTMNTKQFNDLLKSSHCGDSCCSNEPNTHEIVELSTSSDTQSEPIREIPQEFFIDTDIKLRQMATNMVANFKKRNLELPPHLVKMAESELNLITPTSADSSVLNLNQKMVWVQVPCAVDSGACANVTPAGIFSLEKSLVKLEPKFFGADGSPLENLGELVAKGTSEEGIEMKIDFDIAKVTRPLLSVHKMTSNGHKVIFHDSGGYIQVKGTNTKVHLRQEGRLFMLDLWVKVPQEVADSSPFVRQVAKA